MPGASLERLTFENKPEAFANKVDFIQCGAGVDRALNQIAPKLSGQVIIAGVESGLKDAAYASRFVLTWIDEPVYLTPLVEVIPLKETAVSVIERVIQLYKSLNMKPVVVGDSILEQLHFAIQQASSKMKKQGVTDEQIDTILQYGLGLKWLIKGQSQQVDSPIRDEAMLGMMRALRPQKIGPGQLMTKHDAHFFMSLKPQRWTPKLEVEAPLKLLNCHVDPSWIDYNGHMTEASYLSAMGDVTDQLFRYLGIDEAYRASGFAYYTAETHIMHFQECASGDALTFTTQILDFDAKRLHFIHAIYKAATHELVCTGEQLLIHVDTKATKAAPIRPHVLEALTAVYAIHKTLLIPEQVGRKMEINKKGANK